MTDVEPPDLRQTDAPEAVRNGTRLRRIKHADLDHLGFDERLGLLVEHEVTERHGKALALRLQRAKLKPNTAAEDTDYRHARGLGKALYQRLLAGLWLSEKKNVLLTGTTGFGKTWLACPLANQACRMGRIAYYVLLPRLLGELSIGRADGRYVKLLKQLVKIDVLVIDDWGWRYSTAPTGATCWKCPTTATAAARPSSPASFRLSIGTPPSATPPPAEAILDRLVHSAHQLNLKGDSLRKKRTNLTSSPRPE